MATLIAEIVKPDPPAECKHEDSEIRRRVNLRGGVAHVKQCKQCGAYLGAVKRSWAIDPPDFDEELYQSSIDKWRDYQEANRNYYEQDYQRRVEERARRRADFEAYYHTPKWLAKRDQAYQRDHYTCQICGARSQVAHHLTYDHFGNEFLFELVSLCHRCHDSYHPEKQAHE